MPFHVQSTNDLEYKQHCAGLMMCFFTLAFCLYCCLECSLCITPLFAPTTMQPPVPPMAGASPPFGRGGVIPLPLPPIQCLIPMPLPLNAAPHSYWAFYANMANVPYYNNHLDVLDYFHLLAVGQNMLTPQEIADCYNEGSHFFPHTLPWQWKCHSWWPWHSQGIS